MRFIYILFVFTLGFQILYSEVDFTPLSKIIIAEKEYYVTPESFMKKFRPTHKVYGSNAAKHYIKASEYLTLTNEEDELIADFIDPEGSIDYDKLVTLEDKILNNSNYIAELERGFEARHAKWPIFMEKWPPTKRNLSFELELVSLGILSETTNIRSFLAIYAAHKHDRETAFMHLERLERLTEHAKQHNYILINGLVYVTLKSIFYNTASKLMQLNPNDVAYVKRIVELVELNKCKKTDYKPFLIGEKYFCLQSFDELIEMPHTYLNFINIMEDYSLDLAEQDTSFDEYKILTDFIFVVIPEKSMKENVLNYFKLAEEFDFKESIFEYEEKMQKYEDELPEWDIFSKLLLPQLSKSTSAYIRIHQQQKLFSIAHQIYAYKNLNAEWPKSLENLNLNSDLSFDLFSGNQLIYQYKEEPILYSVGQNRKDDQGDVENDIVITFNYKAPQQKELKRKSDSNRRTR